MQRRHENREALNAMMYNMHGCTIRRGGGVQYARMYCTHGRGSTVCRGVLNAGIYFVWGTG